MGGQKPTVGIIANPVSARDIRRIVAYAGNLQITERANIVLRLLAGLGAVGIERVLLMPDNAGIRTHVMRGVERSYNLGEGCFPEVEYLDMEVTSLTQDSITAAGMMRKASVAALIVLGGDGTHRAVVSACKTIPIVGVSSGTNNAFPKFQEPTTVGLATGLVVTNKQLSEVGLRKNKLLEVDTGGRREIALVDVAIVAEHYVGARALWNVQNFKELFVSFAEPEVIGISVVAGLLDPVSREVKEGRRVVFDDANRPVLQLRAPIAPGVIETIGVKSCDKLLPDKPIEVSALHGSIAFDGERELSFSNKDRPTVTLRMDAFQTIDVTACMKYIAQNRLLEYRDPRA